MTCKTMITNKIQRVVFTIQIHKKRLRFINLSVNLKSVTVVILSFMKEYFKML